MGVLTTRMISLKVDILNIRVRMGVAKATSMPVYRRSFVLNCKEDKLFVLICAVQK